MNKLTRAGIALSTVVSMVVASGTSIEASPRTPAAAPSTTVDEPHTSNGWVDIQDAKQLLYIDTHQSSYLHSKIKLLRSVALPIATGQGYNWCPFGTDKSPFLGIFDGQNYTISGVVVNDAMGGSVGLFGNVKGTIRNVRVEDKVTEWQNQANVGGLVGSLLGSIKNSQMVGDVRLMARGQAGTIGGLVGQNGGTISQASAMGSVTVIGGNGALVGGLVGKNTSTIEESFSQGTVSGDSESDAGGLVGESLTGTIKDTYSANAVTAGNSSDLGGLAGYISETEIHNSYSVSPVTKTSGKNSYSGAFSGYNADGLYGAPIYDSFFDRDTSVLKKSAGYEGQSLSIGLQGHRKATDESDQNMRTESTFTKSGWNFTRIWSISPSVNNGYPHLRQVVPPKWILSKPLKQTSGKTVPIPKSLPQPKPTPPAHQYDLVVNGKTDVGSTTNSNNPFMYQGTMYIPVGAVVTDIGGSEKWSSTGKWGGSFDNEVVALPGGKDVWSFELSSDEKSGYSVYHGLAIYVNGFPQNTQTVVVQGLWNGSDVCVPSDFIASKDGLNLPMKVIANGNTTTVFVGNPLHLVHFSGPGVYPDGWKAPVLSESWSPALAKNGDAGALKLFQDKLGFTNGGTSYDISGGPNTIGVSNDTLGQFEISISWLGWGPDHYDPSWDPNLPQAYRIPIISMQLFKFYFGSDAQRVWNYFNTNNIPSKFIANGRVVTAQSSSVDGSVTLNIGYPRSK